MALEKNHSEVVDEERGHDSERRQRASMSRIGWLASDPLRCACLAIALSGCCTVLCLYLSHGALMDHFFFYDTLDTGMDFFHSIEYVNGYVPYEGYGTLYPPFANLFFALLLHFVPQGVVDGLATTFDDLIVARGTAMDLRTHQSTMLMFSFYVMAMTVILYSMFERYLRTHCPQSHVAPHLAAACFLFSFGILYSIERGNIILVSVALCAFFVMRRNDEAKPWREAALVALAASASLKLYPIFFVLLLLRDRRFADTAKVIAYCFLMTILPLFLFKEGLGGLRIWIDVTLNFAQESTTPWVGYGMTSILSRAALYVQRITGIVIPGLGFSAISYLVTLALLGCALFSDKEWKSVLAVILAMLMFKSQADYFLSFFAVALVFMLGEEETLTRDLAIPFVSLLVMVAPLPLFYTVNVSYAPVVVRQLALLVCVIWVMRDAARSLERRKPRVQARHMSEARAGGSDARVERHEEIEEDVEEQESEVQEEDTEDEEA